MTTMYEGQEALFCHQMIPHHQNAVNMAKSLLKNVELSCETVQTEEGAEVAADCELIPMLYDIINTQNDQIIAMRDVLSLLSVEEFAECDVPFAVTEEEASVTQRSASRFLREMDAHRQLDSAFEHGMDCKPCEGIKGDCVIDVTVNLLAGQYGKVASGITTMVLLLN